MRAARVSGFWVSNLVFSSKRAKFRKILLGPISPEIRLVRWGLGRMVEAGTGDAVSCRCARRGEGLSPRPSAAPRWPNQYPSLPPGAGLVAVAVLLVAGQRSAPILLATRRSASTASRRSAHGHDGRRSLQLQRSWELAVPCPLAKPTAAGKRSRCNGAKKYDGSVTSPHRASGDPIRPHLVTIPTWPTRLTLPERTARLRTGQIRARDTASPHPGRRHADVIWAALGDP